MIDCTVEGLLHAPELGEILHGGARVLMISNEHPENFERYAEDPTLGRSASRAGVALLEAAAEMRVTSAAGTDLTARLEGAFRAGSSGVATEPGTIAHWPGGLCLAFPAAHCVEGVVVLAPGDINLTFKTLRPRAGDACASRTTTSSRSRATASTPISSAPTSPPSATARATPSATSASA